MSTISNAEDEQRIAVHSISKLLYLYSGLPEPERGPHKSWGRMFIRAGRDRVKGNGLKLEKSRFKLESRKKFFTEGGETLEQ